MYRKALNEVAIVRNNNNSMLEIVALNQEANKLMTQVIITDENDKKSLALAGVKEKPVMNRLRT